MDAHDATCLRARIAELEKLLAEANHKIHQLNLDMAEIRRQHDAETKEIK